MLKRLEIAGFKSFARKTVLDFSSSVTSVVGPNGSGKSNVAEAFRFALGEQSMKSMRGKRSEDLIWSGSNIAPRANRAAVTIVFDNTKRIFPQLEFDEVAIERAVFRDGASEYAINGSKTRLRDVQELLASANIGETGHHIISQGEADRILSSAPKERRSMLEDALGLKVFEFKKQEAERKLERTEENVQQVEALRREIAPHIRFLAKQVERLDRAEELAKELRALCQTYFAIEEAYLRIERTATEEKLRIVSESLAVLEAELRTFEERVTVDVEGIKRSEAVRSCEKELDRLTGERSELAREIGRVEGALNEAKRRSVAVAHDPYVKVSRDDMTALRDEVESQVRAVEKADQGALHAALQTLRTAITAFFERYVSGADDFMPEEEQVAHELAAKHLELMRKDTELGEAVAKARELLRNAREATMAYEETGREQNRRLLDLAEEKATAESERSRLASRMGELDYLYEDLEQGKREAVALVGVNALSYDAVQALPDEDRRAQEDRKRTMERLKIRVEEAGGSGEDVRSEYKEATDREAFLAGELEDLAKSAAGLKELIAELDTELQKSFAEGLAKVNASFGEFFSLMFGGGGARLVLEEAVSVSEEDEEFEEEAQPKRAKNAKPGIEISVNLPKKRVQALMQLSGGERALTSIALIFAMSQVNPPPFLILDETDAALDEANSRRYGDMIENLSSKSQLIVITHNRETMSRAGILYGVTMGADGISKLLSVKFEEAVSVAK